MGEDSLRLAVETAIRRLERWAEFQERHEREMRSLGRIPRELGPDVPLAANIRELSARLRRSLQAD